MMAARPSGVMDVRESAKDASLTVVSCLEESRVTSCEMD